MSVGIGGRSLIALSDLFKITESFAIDQLDTGPLKPILDVGPQIDWSVGARHILSKTVACTIVGGLNQTTLDFSSAAAWTAIMSDDPGWNGVVPGNFTPSANLGIAVYIRSMSVVPALGGNLTSASLILQNAVVATVRAMGLWGINGATDQVGSSGIWMARPLITLPWCLDRFGIGQYFPAFQASVSADQNVTLNIETLTVPKGLYTRL